MTEPTFDRLKPDKKRRIEAALLKEFSERPFSEATVAGIVRDAGISRGAFYLYFSDLKDAYAHIYRQVEKKAHLPRLSGLQARDPQAYVEAIRRFVGSSESGKHLKFFMKAFTKNSKMTEEMWKDENSCPTPQSWAISLLCHETICSIYNGMDEGECLERLRKVLAKLLA